MMEPSILIIEDDIHLNDGIKLALRSEYHCLQAKSLGEAWEFYNTKHISLMLLDVNLPDGSGFEFLKEIRRQDQVPIILLTANKMEMDVVRGLEMGANDYVTKPFGLAELRARVAVQLRGVTQKCLVYNDGTYIFDFDTMTFYKENEVIELSKIEKRLLRKLVENSGMRLLREQLIDELWQGENEFVDTHALTVVVNRLRKKLDDNAQERIKTIYGIGYVWVE